MSTAAPNQPGAGEPVSSSGRLGPSAAGPDGLSLRRTRPEDEGFCRALFVACRQGELAATGLGAEQCRELLRQQFDLRSAAYRAQFPGASDWVVHEAGGPPIGRLVVAHQDEALVVVDVALLAHVRGAGRGSALLTWITAWADQEGLAVRLEVEAQNPARRLYARFGFECTRGERADEAYLSMVRPARATGAQEFDRFRLEVLADARMAEGLRHAAGPEALVARTAELGQARGYRFTRDDVSAALSDSRRTWFERWVG